MNDGTVEYKQTNEEYIHSLNTEQLAEWLSKVVGCYQCPIELDDKHICCAGSYDVCKTSFVEWLKEKHDE